MKQTTLKKYLGILKSVKKSGKTLKQYCDAHSDMSYKSIVQTISKIRELHEEESKIVSDILTLYSQVTKQTQTITNCEIETDAVAETSCDRDENGHIQNYRYQIFRKNKTPLCGRLSREEMDTIYRLYSYYGDSLTQRVISRYFVELSLIDFKRILRAFNITKASSPFAPHMFEEKSEEELREIQLREKENSFLRKAEEDNIRNTEKLLKKYAQENIELKKKIEKYTEFSISIPKDLEPLHFTESSPSTGLNLNLYLSDIHLGAKINSGALYQENINYGYNEAKRRLVTILHKLECFESLFDTINVVLLGDNVDCPGFFGKTARLDHDMPENMDPREQANSFIKLIMWFVESLYVSKIGSNINIYSVPCGNHGGNFEYMCNKALMASINAKFPDAKTTMWEEFYGVFKQSGHTFVCAHGN
jgi:hypothetical protein